jgi:hypothetical protein
MALLHQILCQEIKDIMMRHYEELALYIPAGTQIIAITPENILICLERLAEICQYSSTETSYELYTEACEYYDTFQDFLNTMNQTMSPDFEKTTVGQIWVQADNWRQREQKQFQLTGLEVWDFIAPAVPDRIVDIGNGQYEARWWKPVPMMDIEILKRTEGVFIHGEPFEPRNLEGGLACQFSLHICLCNEGR